MSKQAIVRDNFSSIMSINRNDFHGFFHLINLYFFHLIEKIFKNIFSKSKANLTNFALQTNLIISNLWIPRKLWTIWKCGVKYALHLCTKYNRNSTVSEHKFCYISNGIVLGDNFRFDVSFRWSPQSQRNRNHICTTLSGRALPLVKYRTPYCMAHTVW